VWSLRVRRLQLGNQEKKEKETLADSDYNIENKADVGSQGLFVSFFSGLPSGDKPAGNLGFQYGQLESLRSARFRRQRSELGLSTWVVFASERLGFWSFNTGEGENCWSRSNLLDSDGHCRVLSMRALRVFF
jgi:hypothetical protein